MDKELKVKCSSCGHMERVASVNTFSIASNENEQFNKWLEEHDKQIRAEAIEEYKYNVVLFREIFLEELERQAVDREEISMYRNICSMAWKKYLEQMKEQKK